MLMVLLHHYLLLPNYCHQLVGVVVMTPSHAVDHERRIGPSRALSMRILFALDGLHHHLDS